MRVFWPTLRDNLGDGVSLEETLRQVERYAKLFGQCAWQVEAQTWNAPPGE